jgi:hypothetical protein
MKRRSDSRK